MVSVRLTADFSLLNKWNTYPQGKGPFRIYGSQNIAKVKGL